MRIAQINKRFFKRRLTDKSPTVCYEMYHHYNCAFIWTTSLMLAVGVMMMVMMVVEMIDPRHHEKQRNDSPYQSAIMTINFFAQGLQVHISDWWPVRVFKLACLWPQGFLFVTEAIFAFERIAWFVLIISAAPPLHQHFPSTRFGLQIRKPTHKTRKIWTLSVDTFVLWLPFWVFSYSC